MAKLFFYRKYHYFHLLGKWNVLINGKTQVSLPPIKMCEIKLKEGTYKIQVKSGSLRSNIININVYDEEIYFLLFIDMPYWKQLPLVFLLYYFIPGGLLTIAKVNRELFIKNTQDNEGLVWI